MSIEKVLVVDDDTLVRKFLQEALHRKKIDVVTAENGQTALDIMQDSSFDMVITDMRLPDLTAYVRLVGGYPITKVKLEFQNRNECAEHFIARDVSNHTLSDVDQLIKNVENQSIKNFSQQQINEREVCIDW